MSMYDTPDVEAEAPAEPVRRPRSAPRQQTMLEDVAEDLALWIDQISSQIALAFAPGRAPFSATLTEQQKMDYYTRALFNPDGSPNQQGRQREVARLGVEQFGRVYKAVVAAHPEFKPATEPMMEVPNG